MTALSDALAATQARAVATLGKQYVAGALDVEAVSAALDAIGLRDTTDKAQWLAALDVIRAGGGEAPTEQGASEPKQDEPASDKQWDFLRKLADEKGTTAPTGPLTKTQASDAITQLQAGTYNPDDYPSVPF